MWEGLSSQLQIINIAAVALYLLLTISISLYQKDKLYSNKYYKTLFRFYTTATLLTYLFFHCYQYTNFAQKITSKQFNHLQYFQPSGPDQLNASYLGRITQPIHSDVIYGDKLDAYYTYQNTYYYDYHPGNREYRDFLKEEITFDWGSGVVPFKALYIQNVIYNNLQSDYFLRQNEYGHWVKLDENEIMNVIDEDVYHMQYPLVRMLLKEVGFMISQCRYGDGGRTYLGAFAGVDTSLTKNLLKFVEGLKERLRLVTPDLIHESIPTTRDFSNVESFKIAIPSISTSYRTPTALLQPIPIKPKPISEIDPNANIPASQQIALINESTKYGIRQNITVGGYNSLQQMITYMHSLQYNLVDDEWMDRIEYENVLKILRNCKNENEFCVHWAGFGYCEEEEHVNFLSTECRPACGLCSHFNYYVEEDEFESEDEDFESED